MNYQKGKPYNDLPHLPPSVELETKLVLKKSSSARAKLAELKGIQEQLPNQSILLRSFVLQEAKLSSEIENIVTTNDELFRAASEIEGAYDLATKEVLQYEAAVWHGHERIKQQPLITTNLCTELAAIIKQQSNLSVRKTTGTRIENSRREVVYTPPEGEQIIRQKLTNLEEFIHGSDDLEPLVKMAIIHYQFEAIHPFLDGNGRTGRILNILYLQQQGIIDLPVLYLSRYIIERKNEYYRLLQGVTEETDWQPWLMYMLDSVEVTAESAIQKIRCLIALLSEAQTEIKEKLPKIYSKDLVEVLFKLPYCRINFLEQAGIAKREAASKYLRKLAEIGLLQSVKAGREHYYINKRMLDWLKA
jgi:Fic family protein